MKPILIYTTFPDAQVAENTAAQLLQEKLIACANISQPMTSIYVWQGKLMKENEVSAMLKTTLALEQALYHRLKTLHPYDVPCILTIPIENADVSYLSWLEQCLIQ